MATGLKLLQMHVGWWNKLEKDWQCHNTGNHARQLKRDKRIAGKLLRTNLKEETRALINNL